MEHFSSSNLKLESVIDDFQAIASELEGLGKKIIELSGKIALNNKYDRNMIFFIKVINK